MWLADSGTTLLTDPLLTDRLLHLRRKAGPTPALPGPPEGLDVGTFMRTNRHWLVVQGSERFAILRLDENNVRQILETFEARTGLKVERVK